MHFTRRYKTHFQISTNNHALNCLAMSKFSKLPTGLSINIFFAQDNRATNLETKLLQTV